MTGTIESLPAHYVDRTTRMSAYHGEREKRRDVEPFHRNRDAWHLDKYPRIRERGEVAHGDNHGARRQLDERRYAADVTVAATGDRHECRPCRRRRQELPPIDAVLAGHGHFSESMRKATAHCAAFSSSRYRASRLTSTLSPSRRRANRSIPRV